MAALVFQIRDFFALGARLGLQEQRDYCARQTELFAPGETRELLPLRIPRIVIAKIGAS